MLSKNLFLLLLYGAVNFSRQLPDIGTIPSPDCDGYVEGDSWKPSSCVWCSCEFGEKSCFAVSCAPPPCENPIFEEDVCCPTCPYETTTMQPTPVFTKPPDCDGYEEGDFWQPHPCAWCYCEFGMKQCAVATCSPPRCENPIFEEGACCSTCPDETTTMQPIPVFTKPPDCDGYKEGDFWQPHPCAWCSCEFGMKQCAVATCSPPRCENPIFEEGACCSTCQDETTTVTLPDIFTKPLDCDGYAEGESWQPHPCAWCSCDFGMKHCAVATCAPPPCENPFIEEGACCPTCPDETTPWQLPNVTTVSPSCDGYAEGDSWEPQPCEYCSCVSGVKTCASPYCYVPCDNPIPGEGLCCPTCPEETHCKKVKKCGQRSYWDEERCKCVCHPVKCLPGYTFNAKKCRCKCKRKKCPQGFYFDKKCCECKCRTKYLECEPREYFNRETCRCEADGSLLL